MDRRVANMYKGKTKYIKDIIPTTLLFAFMMFVFAPFEIYLSNKGYFFFPGWDMLGISCILFVCSFIMITVVLFVLSVLCQKVYNFIFGCFFGGTIALYLQGNWDTTDYGAWNGSEIDWSLCRLQLLNFLMVFILLIIGCALFSLIRYESFSKISGRISLFLLAVLVVTLSVLCITKGGLSKDKEYICTTEEELALSSNENMLVLVLDAFDSSAFKSLIEGKEGELYKKEFEDFTYYPDAVTAYSSTDMSLPQIITGKGYKNEKRFGEFLDEAYEESELMNWLDENGWEKDIYTDALMPQGNGGQGIDNCKLLERAASNRKELMYYMYTMVAFRYTPQPIKNHFYFYADNIKGNLNKVIGDYEAYGGNDIRFYHKIDELNSIKDKGVFQLIHIEGAHEPFTVSSDCTEVAESSYEEECVASLKISSKLIEKLKKEGIYDNSIIIILADHGYSNGRQNPLLMIKGRDEKHSFAISEKEVSYYDLQNAYIELLDKHLSSEELFGESVNVLRGRLYCSVPFNTHLNFDTFGGEMREFACKGKAWDQSTLVATGNVYEEKEIVTIK